MSQSLKPWKIFECYGPHEECPVVWQHRYLDHQIICLCACGHKHRKHNARTSSLAWGSLVEGNPLVAVNGEM